MPAKGHSLAFQTEQRAERTAAEAHRRPLASISILIRILLRTDPLSIAVVTAAVVVAVVAVGSVRSGCATQCRGTVAPTWAVIAATISRSTNGSDWLCMWPTGTVPWRPSASPSTTLTNAVRQPLARTSSCDLKGLQPAPCRGSNDLLRDRGGSCDLILSRRHPRIRGDVQPHPGSHAWPRMSRRPFSSSDRGLASYRAVPTHR